MTQGFDKDYWESHWQQANEHRTGQEVDPNPYLAREISTLAPGTALDAGCGEGAEAIWLANQGWQVTAADISTEALSRASERATKGFVLHPTGRHPADRRAPAHLGNTGARTRPGTAGPRTQASRRGVGQWDIVTANEPVRTLTNRAGRTVQLDDVVVRSTRKRRPTGL